MTKRFELDGAENRPGRGINLMNFPLPILPDPQRPFGPCEPGVAAAAGRGDRGEHAAGHGIDLLDAILGELIEMPAVEGRAGVGGDADRARLIPALRIEGVELVSGREPDAAAVERNPAHAIGARKGPILTDDFGR